MTRHNRGAVPTVGGQELTKPEQGPPPPATGSTIELPPLPTEVSGYIPEHVDVGRLTPKQGLNLKRMRDALDRDHTRLENKRPIYTSADVIRFLLESV